MSAHLTFAYATNRPDCRIEWFFQSLSKELGGKLDNMSIAAVDFHALAPGRADYVLREFDLAFPDQRNQLIHRSTKPCVWQGEHRLTKHDYYAYATARNTALCLAPDGWLACVDDLAVIMPGWMNGAREAMTKNYIACAAYKKVIDLSYVGGVANYVANPDGIDTRWKAGSDTEAVKCGGGWMYGWNVAPIEALLRVNGWDEDSDLTGMGGGDYLMGLMLEAGGCRFGYDRRMLALEDYKLHHQPGTLVRDLERGPGKTDASLRMLTAVYSGKKVATNYFPGGIRAERERVLNGGEFTIPAEPSKSWYSGKPLSEL
jgi:hypothetical protein